MNFKSINLKLLYLLCPILLFLSFNKHSKDKQKSYHDVIWADAAGYYVYNPIWFIYGNSASTFPDSIDVKTGNGFYLNKINNTVETKYSCGTALLQSPFFIASHLLAKPLGYENNGFSKIYSFGLYVAGVFYFFISFLLLFSFLKKHFSEIISVTALIVFFIGSNLYYYTIDAPGMSHIYSFFIFSIIIYISPFLISKYNKKHLFVFLVASTLAILIRPTNILIILFPLIYKLKEKNETIVESLNYFKKIISTNYRFLVIIPLILVPQVIYWKKTTGHFISYSYTNEGFDNWNKPKLLEVWFSTNNGLFTYSPLLLLSIIGIVLMIIKRDRLGIYLGVLFLIISYVFASWWSWWFGCSFGGRSFIEYYSLLIIPFAFLLSSSNNKIFKSILLFIIIGCCYINLSIEYYYDGCFYGETWDFNAFMKLID
ncbi:MAG: hypothetical protein JNL69_05260 [Bacteroidia bacterium]|nr:hypothetical protein [Bacteroidia bacterium]